MGFEPTKRSFNVQRFSRPAGVPALTCRFSLFRSRPGTTQALAVDRTIDGCHEPHMNPLANPPARGSVFGRRLAERCANLLLLGLRYRPHGYRGRTATRVSI